MELPGFTVAPPVILGFILVVMRVDINTYAAIVSQPGNTVYFRRCSYSRIIRRVLLAILGSDMHPVFLRRVQRRQRARINPARCLKRG